MDKVDMIEKQELDKLYNEDTTLKQYNEILNKIDQRFSYVYLKIAEIYGRKVNWFDYDNGYEETDGKFDPDAYSEEIFVEGDIKDIEHRGVRIETYLHSVPTRFLYDYFEDEVKAQYEETKKMIDKEIEKRKKRQANKKVYLSFLSELSNVAASSQQEFVKEMKNCLNANGFEDFSERDFEDVLNIVGQKDERYKKIAKKAAINLFRYYSLK